MRLYLTKELAFSMAESNSFHFVRDMQSGSRSSVRLCTVIRLSVLACRSTPRVASTILEHHQELRRCLRARYCVEVTSTPYLFCEYYMRQQES
jgi:hypothetical protein